MTFRKFGFLVFPICCLVVVTTWLQSSSSVGAIQELPIVSTTDQIIIKFQDGTNTAVLLLSQPDKVLPFLSQVAGTDLWYKRPMSGDVHVLKLSEPLHISDLTAISTRLSALEEVVYAEPDLRKQIIGNPSNRVLAVDLIPNDPLFANQWHYIYTPNTDEGINLLPAWDITTGSTDTVVAVIDTGILPNHTDLVGRFVAGYDFISDVFVANDGDGRDSDPSDPGDWILANECGFPHSAQVSSWHGTHVAGTIGAATNNNTGVAGVNWNASILPVRVLGKCGGYTSDIVDGSRWAAGLSVIGVPSNTNPADVLNLSLGGIGSCSTTEQNAIDEIVSTGVTIIVAAGNENQNAANSSPGNCDNVITVAATDRTGEKAFYSNFGNVVEISAPGGETTTIPNGVLSTLDSGTTTPLNDSAYAYYQGTSMAAPHVAGVVSLIKGIAPTLTSTQILEVIQTTARNFPAGSSCTTALCGAGILDAYQSLDSLVGVHINPPTQMNSGFLGETVIYEFALLNLTGTTDSFDLVLGTHDWDTTLSVSNIGPLANGAEASFIVSVTVPLNASLYQTDTTIITATSVTNPGLYLDSAVLTTQAVPPPSTEVIPAILTSTQYIDEVVTKTFVIYNNRYVTSTFSFSPPFNPLANPDFEEGATGWTEFSSSGFDLILPTNQLPVTPQSGDWAAWLGGGNDEIAYISQTVTIPTNLTILSYWHWVASADLCGFDFAGVLVNNTVVDVYDLCEAENTGGWVNYLVDLSAYAGQVVSLQIRVETDSSINSNLFVDNASFQANTTMHKTSLVSSTTVFNQVDKSMVEKIAILTPSSTSANNDELTILKSASVLHIANGDPAPWLTVNPVSGTISPNSSQVVSVTFNAQGLEPNVYSTELTLYSNDPDYPMINIPVTMTVLLYEPITGLVATNNSPTQLDETTTLTATVVSGSKVIYTWDFGDDSIGFGSEVTHTYLAIGVYTATITATNNLGAMTTTTTVTIVEPIYHLYLPTIMKPDD